METASVTYLGELRTEALHTRSGDKVITDAPPDNQGRGEAFSPTDLLSTSLACCMMTLMGIAAREKDIPLNGLSAKVYKHMSASPRKVERVEVHMTMDGEGLVARKRTILETAARTCPVARSLHPDLLQDISFTYR